MRRWSDKELISKCLAFEGSGVGTEAMILIGRVIRNRMIQRGLSARDVILEPHQFSFLDELPNMKERTAKELSDAWEAWELSQVQGTDCNLYHDITIDPPYWAKHPRVEKRVTIKNPITGQGLVFYYERR